MEMEESTLEQDKPLGVYVKINQDGFVTDVNSDIFIKDFTDWKKIDEGYGDKFAHAQTQYFEVPLMDENGEFQIRYYVN